jgi:Raf kinase inhibitor-like YbhB/YbcL family protein
MKTEKGKLIVSSPAFQAEGEIPSKYTCEGEDVNPPLQIGQIPEDAVTLALIMEDPDAPGGTFDHWLVWNIERTSSIREATNPGINGLNSGGKTGYHGPCPPRGSHRYYFHVFALDAHLHLRPGMNKQELKEAMASHILAEGSIMGRYRKKQ